jgi:hypothetical protein
MPGIFAGEPLRSGILVKEARMDIIANGASIGFVKIPQGTKVMVLSTNAAGDLLIKRNAGEAPFPVPLDSVSIEAPAEIPSPTPASAKTEPPAQSFPAPSATPSPISSTPSAVTTSMPGSKEPSAAEVNKALGIPLFGSGSLWVENDAMVANRLRWPQESKTSREAGYRRYPYTFNSETRVLGARSAQKLVGAKGAQAQREEDTDRGLRERELRVPWVPVGVEEVAKWQELSAL